MIITLCGTIHITILKFPRILTLEALDSYFKKLLIWGKLYFYINVP